MITIDVDIKPKPSFCAALVAKLERELRNMRPPLEDSVDRVLRPAIIENFEASGPGWQRLAPSTLQKRQRAGIEGDEPLIATGRLERAASARARWYITRDYASFNNLPRSLQHGFYHEFGARDGHFPARPWAEVDRRDADNTQGVFNRWVGLTIKTELAAWR